MDRYHTYKASWRSLRLPWRFSSALHLYVLLHPSRPSLSNEEAKTLRRTAGVILAAGAATRFGRAKQLLDWHGVPLVAHVADVASTAGLEPIIVVLGCEADAVRAALGHRLSPREQGQAVQTVVNWHWQAGMSTSLRTGLYALPEDVEAAIFLQSDQPLISPALLYAMMERFASEDAGIVHPVAGGRRSSPVLFARRFFPELARVTGDQGGRSLIARYADQVATVTVDDPLVLTDVDTPTAYERLQALERPRRHLAEIRHAIIDMDGVLWHGEQPMPGLPEFFAFLERHHIAFVLATNNSSRSPGQYVAKLARFGVSIPEENVLTSGQATAAYLASIAPPGAPVYPIGGEGLRHTLTQYGFVCIGGYAAAPPAQPVYVVVGWDPELTWKKLEEATLLINAGAQLIGTNPDRSYPTERGPVPGNGAQLAALEAATGVSAVVVGKPSPWMYREALRRMDAGPETTVVIGDRLDTDIPGGVRLGMTTVLVLSGITRRADLEISPVRPDILCADIGELTARWSASLKRE